MISNWETGANSSDLSNLHKICKVFNVNSNKLLNFNKNDNSKTEADKNKKKIITNIIISIIDILLFTFAIMCARKCIILNNIKKERGKAMLYLLIIKVSINIFSLINSFYNFFKKSVDKIRQK